MSILRDNKQIMEHRWFSACEVVSKYKEYFDTGDYIIMDSDGEVYSPHDTKLVIDYPNKNIYFDTKCKNNSRILQQIYEADLECDHGSQLTPVEFEMEFKRHYQLYSRKPIEL